MQNLLSKVLAEKNDVVIWHDVLNNSISRHDSNNFCSLSVPDLVEVLKGFQNKLCALVYCHRYRTLDIFQQLKVLEADLHVKVFNIVKDFISPKKQKDAELLEKFKALHQSPELELKISTSCSVKRTIFLSLPRKAAQRGLASVPETLLKGHL